MQRVFMETCWHSKSQFQGWTGAPRTLKPVSTMKSQAYGRLIRRVCSNPSRLMSNAVHLVLGNHQPGCRGLICDQFSSLERRLRLTRLHSYIGSVQMQCRQQIGSGADISEDLRLSPSWVRQPRKAWVILPGLSCVRIFTRRIVQLRR